MGIDLPKDAAGREIPLDTDVLYTEDGKHLDVNRFTYSVVQTIPNLKWGVVFMDCAYDYCCAYYLTPPDSWEALEEDIDRCSTSTRYAPCAYFNKSNYSCEKCVADPSKECLAQLMKHIASRIHKLRGEAARDASINLWNGRVK